jgi:hypothetical protein
MGSSSNTRLAALTFWVVAVSVAIAVVGSSRFLFPGTDIGGEPSTPPGRDVVARVVAPVFGPSPVRREAEPPPAPAPAEAPTASTDETLVFPPATLPVAERNPVRRVDQDAPAKPRPDTARKARRADKSKAGVDKQRRGKAIAGAKAQGWGRLKLSPPRGPKQPHVPPAKGHAKSQGKAKWKS